MNNKRKIALLRETKTPPDKRVPLSPAQVALTEEMYSSVKFCIQKSPGRCFDDSEYEYLNVPVHEDVNECDLLLGVKEVKIDALIDGKTYMMFAHVAKKQPHNRELLRAVLKKNITLIDYEYLTRPDGTRIVAFGRWAGIVGAYNALRARGLRTDFFKLKPAHECRDMEELQAGLRKIKLKPIKILITGGGRVASGALETLSVLRLKKVTPEEFLTQTFDEAVICQLEPIHYVKRTDGQPFEMLDFIVNPHLYESTFKPYTKVADIFIACHFWDNRSPVFIQKEDYLEPDFNISVIADVSCDLNGPIASTVRVSTIAEPFYGYNRFTGEAEPPFTRPTNITIMAVDNLPGELPRDASREFGRDLIYNVFPHLFGDDHDKVIERATIAKDGKLMPKYAYLQDYVDGKE